LQFLLAVSARSSLMAAVFPVYHLVRASQNLLEFLAEHHPEAKRLGEAVVVCHGEPFPVDHDYRGQTADCETFAKLCYLAGLERDRILSSKGPFGAALSELLGSAPMTVATFHRWWSLERVGVGFRDLDRLIEEVPLDVLKRIEGPRERSALAEEASREEERRSAERRSSGLDEVTGLPTSAEKRELPVWPSTVGSWWDDLITRRAQGTES
jgi:hypothetical protein